MGLDPLDLDYTLSIFGEVDYLENDQIELLLPNKANSYGC